MDTFLQHFLEKIHYSHPLFLLHLFLTFIFILVLIRICLNKNTRKNNPPSPPRLPIFGNLHQLVKPPHRSLHALSQKYGELMLLQLGNKSTLVVSSATAAREIMKTHDVIFSNRPKLTIPSKLFYDGRDVVFCNYGDYWRQIKSIHVTQLLSTARVRSFQSTREEETLLMMEKITGCIPSVVNLTEIIATLTNDLVCRAAFGRKYSDDKCSNFMALLSKFTVLLTSFSFGDCIPWLSWIDRANGLVSEVDRVWKEFDTFLEGVIEEHLRNSDINDEPNKVKDFVDVLLEIQRESKLSFPLDRDCIKAQILVTFAGGTESSYATVEWAMSELLRHPEAMSKLQREVRGIAEEGKAMINEADVEKMKYLKAVIKETLRLHPPAPLLVFHESSHDVKVNGYDIAANTQVIINAWAIHRDSSYWENPDEFFPDRFLNSKVDCKGQDFNFIPFGSGRRICPGVTFALASVEFILANLVYAFEWALPCDTHRETLDMDESDGIVAHRRYPLLLAATPYLPNQLL